MKFFKSGILLFSLLFCAVQAWADPPGRAGQISYIEGNVTYRDFRTEESGPVSLNWPVVSDMMITTGRRSRTELRIGSTAVRLDASSELEAIRIDDNHLVLRLNRGAAIVRIRNNEIAREFEMETPQTRIRPNEPARFRVDAGYAPDASAISVQSGSVRFDAGDASISLSSGRRAESVDGDLRVTNTPDYGRDDFDDWVASRENRDDRANSVRYVSSEMTGVEDLDAYGGWRTTVEYGRVWYPHHVPVGWAPYRSGRWLWVEPWGWTWVDSAPWGYAPSHYGRWVWLDSRWCWTPGTRIARPMWAPALVGWVGGKNWSVSTSIGSPAVGWFPLAPREVYVPAYRVSPTYIKQVNVTHVTNITNVTYVNGNPAARADTRYRNRDIRHAVTALPGEHFKKRTAIHVTGSAVDLRDHRALRTAPSSPLAPAAIVPRPISIDQNPSISSASREDRSARMHQRLEHMPANTSGDIRSVEGTRIHRNDATATRHDRAEKTDSGKKREMIGPGRLDGPIQPDADRLERLRRQGAAQATHEHSAPRQEWRREPERGDGRDVQHIEPRFQPPRERRLDERDVGRLERRQQVHTEIRRSPASEEAYGRVERAALPQVPMPQIDERRELRQPERSAPVTIAPPHDMQRQRMEWEKGRAARVAAPQETQEPNTSSNAPRNEHRRPLQEGRHPSEGRRW